MPNKVTRPTPHNDLQRVRTAETLKSESELPAPKADLSDLLEWVGVQVGESCDNTMRYTLDFIRKRRLDEERVIVWLRQYGGCCDCEVAMNVEHSCPAMK